MLIDEAHISMGLSHNNIAHISTWAGGRPLLPGAGAGRRLGPRADSPARSEAGAPCLRELGTLHPGRGVLGALVRARQDRHAGRPLGIVHRDVSPQNVLFSEQGEVKITDFGVAKAMTKRDRTGAGIVKGKLALCRRSRRWGKRSTCAPISTRWASCFICCHRAASLRWADRHGGAGEGAERAIRPRPNSEPHGCRPRWRTSSSKAMNLDRNQRYQSADELLIDLEGIMRAEFGASGQTALKLWLSALGRRDGEMPISHAQATHFSKPGSESVEGKSVELGDEDEAEEEDVAADLGRLEMAGGRASEPTVRAVPSRRMPPPRITGSEATSLSDLAVALSDDGPRAGSTPGGGRHVRHATSDMAMPVVTDDEPPVRMGRRSGGAGFFKGLLAIFILGGAAAGIWHMLQGKDEVSSAATPPDPAANAATAPTPVPTTPAAPTAAAPTAPAPAVVPPPAPRANPPASDEKRTAHERTHAPAPAPDPYARARSWQKPDEPIAPGLPTTPEHVDPKPTEEKPAGEASGTTP